MAAFFQIRKKVHWSDTDAAGVAWFPNFLGWFEDAEEELFVAALGRSRQSLLETGRIGMPRVEANIRYAFEMWDVGDERRVAHGFVRVGCVSLDDFVPRDFPADVLTFARRIHELAASQTESGAALPWA